jgi:hypothetical protein
MLTSNVGAAPTEPVSDAERRKKQAAARRAIREALWEGTNALPRAEWEALVIGVFNEIQSDEERAMTNSVLETAYEVAEDVRRQRNQARGELANVYVHLGSLCASEPGDWRAAVIGLLPDELRASLAAVPEED